MAERGERLLADEARGAFRSERTGGVSLEAEGELSSTGDGECAQGGKQSRPHGVDDGREAAHRVGLVGPSVSPCQKSATSRRRFNTRPQQAVPFSPSKLTKPQRFAPLTPTAPTKSAWSDSYPPVRSPTFARLVGRETARCEMILTPNQRAITLVFACVTALSAGTNVRAELCASAASWLVRRVVPQRDSQLTLCVSYQYAYSSYGPQLAAQLGLSSTETNLVGAGTPRTPLARRRRR